MQQFTVWISYNCGYRLVNIIVSFFRYTNTHTFARKFLLSKTQIYIFRKNGNLHLSFTSFVTKFKCSMAYAVAPNRSVSVIYTHLDWEFFLLSLALLCFIYMNTNKHHSVSFVFIFHIFVTLFRSITSNRFVCFVFASILINTLSSTCRTASW